MAGHRGMFKPLFPELFWWNRKIYLHFLSFLDSGMCLVVEKLPHWKLGPVYIAWWTSWPMMTSSNGTIFRITGPLCVCVWAGVCVCVCVCVWGGGGGGGGGGGDPPVTSGSPHKGHWRGALMFSLICAWTNILANNGDAGDLRHYRAHYDVTVTRWWHGDVKSLVMNSHDSSHAIFRF